MILDTFNTDSTNEKLNPMTFLVLLSVASSIQGVYGKEYTHTHTHIHTHSHRYNSPSISVKGRCV